MIKNERQYEITSAQARKFKEALRAIDENPECDASLHPLMRKAKRDALQSQLDDLVKELEEYVRLRDGIETVLELDSLEELPKSLIKARIAANLSQKQLAERLGLKEQQIQRYEATDYATASLDRLREVAQVLGIRFRNSVFLPSAQVSVDKLWARLSELGVEKDLVLKRLIPMHLAETLRRGSGQESEGLLDSVLRAADVVRRVFRISQAELFGGAQLQLNPSIAGLARFKVTAGANAKRLTAYTVYAHYLALLVLDATKEIRASEIPADPRQLRAGIIDRYGSITLENVLNFAWDLGIPVLPLNDSGAFHGAFWRVDGRNVIVLKQQTGSEARWLFDILHELFHASQEPDLPERSVLEGSELDDARRKDKEERLASRFAGDVMLDGRAEDLVKIVMEKTGGRIPLFKKAVPQVAESEGFPADFFANYMAYRLSLQNENWWGTANNLQRTGTDPVSVARKVFQERCSFSRLNPTDQALLAQALVDVEVVNA